MIDATNTAQIAAMGRELSPGMLMATRGLYAADQSRLASSGGPVISDLAYGLDPRQVLDVYPSNKDPAAPVLVWVHGGGFVRGEKSAPDHPFEAHVGHWAARHGLVGVVLNYRLAPTHQWPSGAEDLDLAIDWLAAHVADHGGDPGRIILMGSSAGAAHIGTYVQFYGARAAVRGAILLSGLYGVEPYEDPARDLLYFGSDCGSHPERRSLTALAETAIPLLVAGAEFDPPRFQKELVGLISACLAKQGHLPKTYIASGHNHFSLPYHLGSQDTRVEDELLAFIREVSK